MEDLCQKIARFSEYTPLELEALADAQDQWQEPNDEALNTYAITISPPQRIGQPYAIVGNRQYHYITQKQIFHDDYRILIGALRGSVSKCKIYPEISDNGRLHYHGTVVVKDYVKWKKRGLTRLTRLGFIKVKPSPNEKWGEYCKKEWEQTKEVLDLEQPITEALLEQPCRHSNKTIVIQKEKKQTNQQSIYSYFKPSIGN